MDGDERVLAAAQQIMKSLGTSTNMKEDMMFILSNLGSRFADIGKVLSFGDENKSQVEEQLDAAEKLVREWDADSGVKGPEFLFSESHMDEANAYLSAVDDVVKIVEELRLAEEVGCLLERAEIVLQMAMCRLEEEFRHVLISNAIEFDAETLYESMNRLCYKSDSDVSVELEIENENDAGEEMGNLSSLIALVNPVGVDDLKDIADRMIKAGYKKECCQVYTSIRREALDEFLALFGIEKLRIEEVQKIEWSDLDEMMKKWSQTVKVMVKVVLTGERELCDQVFGESSVLKGYCFGEISKCCILRLLSFAVAVAVGRRTPEKLFRILDMYDALSDVLRDLRVILCDELQEFIREEVDVVLGSLGKAAKGTFQEFENAVKGETCRKTTIGGEIHPLTRYVMNYIKLLVDYRATLNGLFDDIAHDQNGSPISYNDGSDSRIGDGSPLAHHLLLILSSLEANLEDKSRLYDDKALRYVFMMNNIHYIVQKVKSSELSKMLGDQWIRTYRGKIRQCATCYLRSSWSKVLACIKDGGLGSNGGFGTSSSAFKASLKEKFKNFNTCFEEIYKIQTAWKVPDPQLREEMRISISEKVIPAYRSFMGRYRNQVENARNAGKYVKYTADDLENYLLEFFEGNPGTINHQRRKTVG